MVDYQNFKQFVLSQLPNDFVEHIVNGIVHVYQSSYNYVFERYEREQAIDHLPHFRRTEIENFLRYLPNKFSYAKSSSELNYSANCHHVEVTINQIVFTQSFVKLPDEKVRDAKFRNSLSDFNIQEKFDFGDTEKVVNTDKYYAILRHGSDSKEASSPDFFNIAFPTNNNENRVEPINLLKLYNISLDAYDSVIESIRSKTTLINPPLKKLHKIDSGNK